jgi:hypothetical protein
MWFPDPLTQGCLWFPGHLGYFYFWDEWTEKVHALESILPAFTFKGFCGIHGPVLASVSYVIQLFFFLSKWTTA